MPKNAPILCPSAMCKPGNRLIGIVDKGGKVSFLEQPITLDKQFVSFARLGRTPEKRFRFSTPCIEKSCKQWANGRCGVGDEVVSVLGNNKPLQNDLPKCGIRSSCRWYLQSGRKACAVCPEVITDTTV